ncbi:unnamed protein product [Cuscuta epithymum]|uniref:RNase H type-1 domain-containing protein n=1 Tax=Cuscuta epithymum TaxID=186058 RepID=A0AAV0GE54_9ASTE|nr:unnamed protein product [Cuscuta epithymum]
MLFEENLISDSFNKIERRYRVVRWNLPVSSFKLNVDASLFQGQATGGAVMRSKSGNFVWAISFPVEARSVLEAERHTLYTAVSWAIGKGFRDFEVESDSLEVIRSIEDGLQTRRWRGLFEQMRIWKAEHHISFGHIFREQNWPAHYLSRCNPDASSLQAYFSINELHSTIKKALCADNYGLFYFRH